VEISRESQKNSDENLETHNTLIEHRHQFIAHRGDTESEVGISYLLVPKNDKIENAQIRFNQLKLVSFSSGEIIKIETLIKFIIGELVIKIQKSGQKTYEGMLNSFTPEELTSMLMNNLK